MRALTREVEHGHPCPRSTSRAQVRMKGLTLPAQGPSCHPWPHMIIATATQSARAKQRGHLLTRSSAPGPSRPHVGGKDVPDNEPTRRAKLAARSPSGRHRHNRQINVAPNLSRSFFKMLHKRCNSNDVDSIFELIAWELRAKLLVDSHSWASGQRTEQHQPRRPHRCAGRRRNPRARRPENPRRAQQQPAPHSNT